MEILISDNASTDNTPVICQEYAARNEIIKYRRNEENIGIIENFRKLLNDAAGSYFSWAADDDWWSPEFFSILIGELEQYPDAVLAMCSAQRVTVNGIVKDTIRLEDSEARSATSHFGMILKVLGFPTKSKSNFYMLGVHRTRVLRESFSVYPEVPGLDRLLVAQLALVGRFRYVDKVLLRKTIYERSQKERRAEETYNKLRHVRGIALKRIVVLISAVLRSRVVPWPRKICLPVIGGLLIGRYIWRSFLRTILIPIWLAVRPYLPVTIVQFVRRRFRFVIPNKMS